MKLKFILFLFPFLSSTQSFAIDVGDGSDGICDEVTIAANPKNYYQCTTLDINGALTVFKAGAAGANVGTVVIKVQNDVNIEAGGTIDLSGANGVNGNNTNAVSGGAAGAGGGAGGSSTATIGSTGSGSGAGTGGALATVAFGTPYGGGGGGGSFGTVVGAIVATNGTDDGGPVIAGSNGTTYFPEINFDNSFTGGSGGAAGGAGVVTATSIMYGSSGGGGGGAIHIVAGGDITVVGSIISNGGNGGGTAAIISSGGGGGGSGGAIWLQAAGVMDVTGSTITATGGTRGINDSSGLFDYGLGGSGGKGRIRLDDADGVIDGVGGENPGAYSTTFTPTAITSGATRQYTSAVACGRVSLNDEKPFNNLINLILGMMLASLVYLSVHFWTSRKAKV